MVGTKAWNEIKSQVFKGDSYKQESWYIELADHYKTLLEDLKQIQ